MKQKFKSIDLARTIPIFNAYRSIKMLPSTFANNTARIIFFFSNINFWVSFYSLFFSFVFLFFSFLSVANCVLTRTKLLRSLALCPLYFKLIHKLRFFFVIFCFIAVFSQQVEYKSFLYFYIFIKLVIIMQTYKLEKF